MEEPKCKICSKKWDWAYATKNDYVFYCDEHLPCGKFKRFIGKYITPIVIEVSKLYFF